MATDPSLRGGQQSRRKSGNEPGRGWPEKNGGPRNGRSLTGSSQDIHRTLPHSIEAEQGVLGSMLISPREIIAECVEKINEQYFYVPAHQTVYAVLVELWNAGQGIDLITFTQVLRDRNVLETVGGAAFITSLFTFVPTAANVTYYLEIASDMNIVEHVAINGKLPVAVFSLEMSSQQLVQRLLCSRARVNLQKVRDGFLAERDFPSLTAAASKLAEAQIFIDDSAGLSILELRAKARRLKAQKDIKLIVVDYLQLLRSTTRRAQDNRQLEISEISAGLKGLAKELKIPIIVIAQLNRQPEARTGGKPRLSDLRESGSIEQDADLVGLLVRPEIYEEDEDARAEKAGEAELIIAKQRNGPVGEIALTFLKEFTRFEDRARNVAEPM